MNSARANEFIVDYPDFQTLRVFENPEGLKIRYVFAMWIIIRNLFLPKGVFFHLGLRFCP
ncbi:MAG: hypothetical protein B6D41_20070 [Chloroflexi bacterium UTCFX4]|jgi:hypothetical protein|nr:MAG: hypothetical protein B6D41_20070 [Chloroflexi bacterium UTCFX4]